MATACKKDPPPLDFNINWYVQAESNIKIHRHTDYNGSKISNHILKKGEKVTLEKTGYTYLEVQCVSNNCLYRMNNQPFTETKIFDK